MTVFKKNLHWCLLIFSVALIFAACRTTPTIETDAASNFSLANYATYHFYEIETSEEIPSPTFEKNVRKIKAAIAHELETRGLSAAEDAHLNINIGIIVEEKQQTTQSDIISGPRPFAYMGQRRYRWQSETITGSYNEGAVTIDLVDTAKNEVVWQGFAEKVIPDDQKKLEEAINKTITSMFEAMDKQQ